MEKKAKRGKKGVDSGVLEERRRWFHFSGRDPNLFGFHFSLSWSLEVGIVLFLPHVEVGNLYCDPTFIK